MKDLEVLIEQVKQHECLYNPDDKHYNDNDRKDVVWFEIGKLINCTGPESKKHWCSLRDSFRRAKKKRGPNTKKWKYEDEMRFLLPYLKNISLLPFKAEVDNTESCSDVEVPNPLFAEEWVVSEEVQDNFHNEHQPSSPELKGELQSPPNPLEIKRIKMQPSTFIQKPRKILPKPTTTKTTTNVTNDDTNDIDLFFQSMAATVKKLSPLNQAIAKAKVFSSVSEVEIEERSKAKNSNHILNCVPGSDGI